MTDLIEGFAQIGAIVIVLPFAFVIGMIVGMFSKRNVDDNDSGI